MDNVLISAITYDVVTVSGEDSVSYLQGQLSQDLELIDVGATKKSLLLTPQGKLVALLRVLRDSENQLKIVIENGLGEDVIARLKMFVLRVDVNFLLEKMQGLAVRAQDESAVVSWLENNNLVDSEYLELPSLWNKFVGVDIFGIDGSNFPDLVSFDAMRILANVPKSQAELISSTIPAAARIVTGSVSFDKGCYVGQELVARIDSRGNNTPERLVSVSSVGPVMEMPDSFAGQDLLIFVDSQAVGRITSLEIFDSALIALGYVKRSCKEISTAEIGFESDAETNIQVLVSEIKDV